MSQYLDELRAKAEAEWAASRTAAQPVEEVLEPEVPAEPVIEEPTEPVTPEPAAPIEEPVVVQDPDKPNRRVVYKKTVDLGDGSPPQVFKASTKDELIDKIFVAQENASKRIKQLKDEVRRLQQQVQPDPAQPARFQPQSLTPEQELEIVNELQINPTGGLAKALEAVLGASLDEVRKTLRDVKERDEIHAVGKQFLATHPEYPINNINEQRMAEYLQKNKLGWTLKNLELAFADLQEVGLITGLVQEAHSDDDDIEEEVIEQVAKPTVTTPVVPVQPTPAPATSTEVPRRRKAVVGISSRQSAAAATPEVPHEASVEDLLRMSPAERRRIVMQQLGRQA